MVLTISMAAREAGRVERERRGGVARSVESS